MCGLEFEAHHLRELKFRAMWVLTSNKLGLVLSESYLNRGFIRARGHEL